MKTTDTITNEPEKTRAVAGTPAAAGTRTLPRIGALPLVKFLAISLQLGLVLWIIHLFNIEPDTGFHQITWLVFVGFAVHAWLPERFRLPFFVMLTVVAVGIIFRFPLGFGLIGIGLGLIGLCHLPIAFWARVALVGAAGAGLAAIRAGWIETFWDKLPALVLPILGSMFMFRLIIYLYDLRHERTPASVWERLAYFFMLPNVVFPLFPVIDYQVFRRTYYDTDAWEIYQKGVLWIFRGVTHLILYRLIYYYVTPSPSDIQGLGGVLLFIVSSYLLYLRVSGLFHLIIGILCLFGFNLPETHHMYFLASGFNDVWRRLNIYWKDFMVKLFYYPVLMRVRRWGMMTARIVATIGVFFVTWWLHSYQWFWLRGSFPVSIVDGLYWGILGVFVVFNTVLVTRKLGSRATSEDEGWSWRKAAVHAIHVVGMFAFMSFLWSFWSTMSIEEWTSIVSRAAASGFGAYALLVLGLASLVAVGVLLQYARHRGWPSFAARRTTFYAPAGYVCTACFLLLFIAHPQVHGKLGAETSSVVASLRVDELNQRDSELLERGYYEGLLEMRTFTSKLSALQTQKPDDWTHVRSSELVRQTGDALHYELIPSFSGSFRDAPFETNEWGMRDLAYTKEKPQDVFRIALIGASIEMGPGVANDQVYETLLEKRLNRRYGQETETRYEILNFAVGGYSTIHNVVVTEEKVFPFEPNALFYVIHSTEYQRLQLYLYTMITEGHPIPDPYLEDVIRRAGVHAGMDRTEMDQAFDPFLTDIIRWSIEQIGASCRSRGLTPVLLYMPHPFNQKLNEEWSGKLLRYGRDAGFITVSLEGAFKHHDPAAIELAPWDRHLSVLGHQLVADRLFGLLSENSELLQLGIIGRAADITQANDTNP